MDDACIVEFDLTGSAATFTSVQGDEVVVEPVDNTLVGLHDLAMAATITSSKYDANWSSGSARNIFTLEIILQRNAEIEEWSMRIIMGLVWAILVLVVSTVYLFCDKYRAAKNLKRKYNS